MKRFAISASLLLAVAILMPARANAFDLKDILGGLGSDKNGTSIVGNLLEGVFMSSNLTTADLMGVWTTDQPAVSFKSDDMLKKAGGIAAASALETKLAPYFDQLGLRNATFTVNADSTFSLKSKKLNLSGSVRRDKDGMFMFKIKVLGIGVGEIPAYVQKTSKSMDVMFDTSQLKKLLNTISKIINIKSISAITSLIDSYEGIYVGFGMNKTGEVEKPTTNGGKQTGASLLDILKGKTTPAGNDSTDNSGKTGKSSTTTTVNDTTANPAKGSTTGSGKSATDKIKDAAGDALRNILGGSKSKSTTKK